MHVPLNRPWYDGGKIDNRTIGLWFPPKPSQRLWGGDSLDVDPNNYYITPAILPYSQVSY